MKKGIIIGSILLILVPVLLVNLSSTEDNIYCVKSSIRNYFNLDKKEIFLYQKYRIEEFNKYHNYDTSYTATAADWYEGHNITDYHCD